MQSEALVVVLAAGGARVECDALDALTGVRVTWVRIERERDAACLAARVRHDDHPDEFGARVRRWAAARGWAVTVAPGRLHS